MILRDILVITGHSGLFKYMVNRRNCVIVENVIDHKRMTMPVKSKISLLEDIIVFTETKDIHMRDVLIKMQAKENGGAAIPHKSPDEELKKYFSEVLPDYDRKRVYASDIRKMVQWYNMLFELGINDFSYPKETEKGETPKESEINNE
jgi:hypothetical protein